MRFQIYLSIFCLFLSSILALAAASGAAEPPQTRRTTPLSGDLSTAPADEDDARSRITRDMEKKAAKERVAALKTDTDKLLKLSVELKSYVDKSNENVLSLEVVKKAEEIEKLARSVKDKMKGPN